MSRTSLPKFSPLIVTRVPGGPSLGDMPVTWGGGLLLAPNIFIQYSIIVFLIKKTYEP